MMKPEININWNEVSFSPSNPSASTKNIKEGLINTFFGIHNETNEPELLLSENNLELNPAFWTYPDQTKIVSTSSNRSFLLLPNEYSVAFEYPLDSLANRNSLDNLIVRAGVWAKAKQSSKAVFVISIEKNGKSLEWRGVDIQDFVIDISEMNFVTNFAVLTKELFLRDGLMLKVYVWNTGIESMVLDDFSVRIEKK